MGWDAIDSKARCWDSRISVEDVRHWVLTLYLNNNLSIFLVLLIDTLSYCPLYCH